MLVEFNAFNSYLHHNNIISYVLCCDHPHLYFEKLLNEPPIIHELGPFKALLGKVS